jgi:outer membrane protein assembly factor BamB
MKQRKRSGLTTYRFAPLALWRTKLPNVKNALLPPSNERPNPLVTESMVVTSIFSPGAVCALERRNGKLLWRKEILGFGGDAVYSADGRLFAKSSHTLYALDADSGEVLWTFCPYGPSGETIYSSPAAHRQSIFIGDRRGFLHCLDVRNGITLWRRRTNRARNDDVNSTPLIWGGLVIVGTNAKRAVAYEVRTGELVWVRDVDGPSTFGPLLFRGFAAIFTDSIYLLEPKTGEVVHKFSWKDDGITGATSTPKSIVGTLRGSWPPSGETQLVGVNNVQTLFSTVHKDWLMFMRYARETKLVYISHLRGIYVCDPNNGRLFANIKIGEERPGGVGLVEVRENVIYALTAAGHVFALRHPRI